MCFICVSNNVVSGTDPNHLSISASRTDVAIRPFDSGPDYIDALVAGYSWTGSVNTAVSVDYTFETSTNGGRKPSLQTQLAFEEALQAFENVANITFNRGAPDSELRFSVADLSASDDGTTQTFGSPNVGTIINDLLANGEAILDQRYDDDEAAFGRFGFQAIMHEIGHMVGLKHPFDSESGTGTTVDGDLDSFDYSIMSFTDGTFVNEDIYSATTPMLLDVAALQHIYGANTSYNAGDTVHVIDGKQAAFTLWDGGGSDTLVANVANINVTMDLTDDYLFDSEIIADEINPGFNQIGDSVFWVALNSAIDNAIASNGDDTVSGNNDYNKLTGHLGSDVIDGWNGNDTIFGGQNVADANDSADIIRGDLGDDLIYGNAGNDTLFGGAGLYNDDTIDSSSTERTSGGTKVLSFDETFTSSLQIFADTQDGGDTIYGGYGQDYIYGDGGNDSLYGGGSVADPNDLDDTIYGGWGDDFITGNGGNDLIYGGIYSSDGLDGVDTLYGGLGDDTLFGNSGEDNLWGQDGDDSLRGGGGDDNYYFYDNNGNDVVDGFTDAGIAGGDRLIVQENINGTGISSAADVLARITYSGTRATIDFGSDNTVTIFGLPGTQLSADDIAIFSFFG